MPPFNPLSFLMQPSGVGDANNIYSQLYGGSPGYGSPLSTYGSTMNAAAGGQTSSMLLNALLAAFGQHQQRQRDAATMQAIQRLIEGVRGGALGNGTVQGQGPGVSQPAFGMTPPMMGRIPGAYPGSAGGPANSASSFPVSSEDSARAQRAGQMSPASSMSAGLPGTAPAYTGSSGSQFNMAAYGNAGGGETPNSRYMADNRNWMETPEGRSMGGPPDMTGFRTPRSQAYPWLQGPPAVSPRIPYGHQENPPFMLGGGRRSILNGFGGPDYGTYNGGFGPASLYGGMP